MKCPSCNYVCSDLRDICPKCLVDLRPEKAHLGLAASNPEATYEELLRKISGPPAFLPEAGPAGSHETTSFIKGLIKVFRIRPPEVNEENNPSLTRAVSGSPEATETGDLDTDASPATAETILIETEKHSFGPESPAGSATHDHPEPINNIPPGDSAPPIAAASEEVPEDPTLQPAAPSGRSYVTESAVSGGLNEVIPGPALQEAVHPENSESSGEKSVWDLYDEVRLSISDSERDAGFELGTAQFFNAENREETEVLFELAMHSLDNPEELESLLQKFVTSEERQVESSALAETLKKTEDAIDVPLLSLKHNNSALLEQIRKSLDKSRSGSVDVFSVNTKKPSQAGPAVRLAASAIDLTATMVFAALLAGVICLLFTPELKEKALRINELQFYEILPVLSLMLVSLIVSLFAYPITFLLIFERTIGNFLTSTRILRGNYKKLKTANIIIRSLIFPLSLLCFGWVPVLFNRLSMHDYLAGTRVVR